MLQRARPRASTAARCSATGCAIPSATASPRPTPTGRLDRHRGEARRSRGRTWPSPGLYFYDNTSSRSPRGLAPSARGELEITDVNNAYLAAGQARLVELGRGFAWLDTGTHDSLLEASQFVQVLEHRQGLRIACLEEVAYRMGYIDAGDLEPLAEALGKSAYGDYVRGLVSVSGRVTDADRSSIAPRRTYTPARC